MHNICVALMLVIRHLSCDFYLKYHFRLYKCIKGITLKNSLPSFENSVDPDLLKPADQNQHRFKPHNESMLIRNKLQHEFSNNVVCATSKPSDQPAHTPLLVA